MLPVIRRHAAALRRSSSYRAHLVHGPPFSLALRLFVAMRRHIWSRLASFVAAGSTAGRMAAGHLLLLLHRRRVALSYGLPTQAYVFELLTRSTSTTPSPFTDRFTQRIIIMTSHRQVIGRPCGDRRGAAHRVGTSSARLESAIRPRAPTPAGRCSWPAGLSPDRLRDSDDIPHRPIRSERGLLPVTVPEDACADQSARAVLSQFSGC